MVRLLRAMGLRVTISAKGWTSSGASALLVLDALVGTRPIAGDVVEGTGQATDAALDNADPSALDNHYGLNFLIVSISELRSK